ncbi:MAG: hypothetical protein DWQ08_05950 [Proteobacteria bacterium]|nr:MAG: hypothetical protein DWQ08_05950 [Pseudomonadota bacterium]
MRRPPPSAILVWVMVTGLVSWGAYALWRGGMLARLAEEDPSKLSLVILAVYGLTQLYAGWLAASLHRDRRLVDAFARARGEVESRASPIVAYLSARRARDADTAGDDGFSYLRALTGDRLSSGWFVADLMFKLGLVGTVIGFILMLGAITDLRSLDIHQALRMLGDMSAGMRLALYTTLTGLSCGALTGIQFHLLERSADTLSREAGALLEREAGSPR